MATKSKDEKQADIVHNRYTKARELIDPVFERIEINRNLYKGFLQTDDQYEWDYSLVDNQVFPLIRNYISRSNPSMTKVRLEARNAGDFEKRQVNQDFVNWEINELPLTQLLTRGFFSNYLCGKAYFKTGWKYDPRVIVKNENYTYEMRSLINRADMKFVRFNNILIPNRNIPTLMDQPYVLETMQLRVGEMIKDNEDDPNGEFWDKSFIAKLRKDGVKGKILDYEAEAVKDSDTMDEMTFRAATFPVVCMQTLEGDIIYVPMTGDTHQIINKNRENPYWHGHYPYIDMTAFPEDDEFFSMSVVDAVGDMGIAGTEVLNQMLTNIRSINNQMWITGASQASTPDYMFTQRPNGIIRVAGDPTGVVPVRPNDASSSMLRIGQEISNKFERTGGISSLYSSGAQDQNINQTARGAQLIDKNIENNVKMILDLFGEQVLERMGNDFCELNAQYVTEEQAFAITGKKGLRQLMTISPDVVTANFDVYTYPQAMVQQTPASRQASLQNLITILRTQAIPAGVSVDLVPIVKNLIDSYPEMENIDDVVNSIDEKAERDFLSLERGQMPEIKVADPHKELIEVVTIHFEENQQNYTPEVQALFTKYAQTHMQYLQAQQEIASQLSAARPPAESINFKDLPVEGQIEMARQAGLNINPAPANPGGGAEPGTTTGTGQTVPYNLGAIAGGT
jgi:hypothetical protein